MGGGGGGGGGACVWVAEWHFYYAGEGASTDCDAGDAFGVSGVGGGVEPGSGGDVEGEVGIFEISGGIYRVGTKCVAGGFGPIACAFVFALSTAGWLFIATAIAAAVVLAKTPFGRTLYASGFNEKAARYSGLRVDRAKLVIYGLSGLMAGVAAINYSAFNDSAQANVGTGIELDVITAVVLGGTSIFGGRGRIIGTVLGVALIHETREFVSWHFHQNELVRVVLGGLLIVAVAANALLVRKSVRS